MSKGRYCRTDHKEFVCQLTRIERRIKQCQRQQAPHRDPSEMASDPQVHYHIGQSEKIFDKFGQYLRNHAGDPAMKVNTIVVTSSIILKCCLGLSPSIGRTYSSSPWIRNH
jgi:hypothetical protein